MKPSGLFFLVIFLSVFPFSSQALNGGIFYQQTVSGFAGPMAPLELANNWKGKFRRSDDGVLFLQGEYGFHIGGFSISRIRRLHAEYHMPHRAAEIFLNFNRNIELDQRLTTTASLQAKDYRGEGVKVAYQFDFSHLKIKPHISWLKLRSIIWGRWSGEFSYKNRNDWDIDLDINYYYTEDKLIRRGTDPGNPLDPGNGRLLTLGLDLSWQWQGYQIDYQGENLAAEIDWRDLPVTKAKASTSGPFFIFGYEFEEDKQFTPPVFHLIHQSYQLNSQWGVAARSWINTIRPDHSLGVQYYQPDFRLRLLHQLNGNAWTLGFAHNNFSLELQTESWNVSRSRWLGLSVAAQLNF